MNVVEKMQSKGLYRAAAFLGLVHLRVFGGRLRGGGYGGKFDLSRLIYLWCELEVIWVGIGVERTLGMEGGGGELTR